MKGEYERQDESPVSRLPFSAKERLIVALDVDDFATAKELVEQLKDQVTTFKVGIPLFTAFGPKAVEMIQKFGGKVFLDLKFHDIPSVVAQAVREVVKLRTFMLTLHASGGPAMLQEAVTAARDEANRLSAPPPLLLAVTVLTSLDEETFKKLTSSPWPLREQVIRLAAFAWEAGMDGIVASPHELGALRAAWRRRRLVLVAAGVRPQGENPGDQKRIMTPREALENGADFIVIGRPITQAKDPAHATAKILKEMEEERGASGASTPPCPRSSL